MLGTGVGSLRHDPAERISRLPRTGWS